MAASRGPDLQMQAGCRLRRVLLGRFRPWRKALWRLYFYQTLQIRQSQMSGEGLGGLPRWTMGPDIGAKGVGSLLLRDPLRMEPAASQKTPDPGSPRGPLAWFGQEQLALAGLLVFTLLVRGGVLWAMRGNLQQDPDAYREIAENLLRDGEFALGKPSGTGAGQIVTPTAYRPPLYPVVLSNLPATGGQQVSLTKVAALHVALGIATVWLTWLTARRVGFAHHQSAVGIARPTIAGLIVACDPILLNQQTLVMTETLAAFLAILSLWCLARFDASRSWFNAALAGGAIGLAVLCRPTFLPWLGMVVGMLVVRGGPDWKLQIANRKLKNIGWRLANLVGLIVAAAAVMSPWAIRNDRVFGKPILTTTHGGYTLYLANNPEFYSYLRGGRWETPWAAPHGFAYDLPLIFGGPIPPEYRELLWDRFLYGEAEDTIREQPSTFLFSCCYRIVQLWSPLPHKLTKDESTGRRLLRYATCAWYCGLYVMVAIGVWRIGRSAAGTARPTDGTPQRAFPTAFWAFRALLQPPWIWGVLLCLAFTAVHTFYWTNLRMRAPLMPFIAIIAGAAAITVPKREPGQA